MRRNSQYTIDQLKVAVLESLSLAQVLRKLGLAAEGGNYASIKRILKRNNITIDHFTGQLWSKGLKVGPKHPLEYYLVKGRPTNSDGLRRRLLREGVMPHQCSRCLLTVWLDEPIPLELDHINGDRDDNLLENLRLLCPNCHAKTSTYRGRGKEKSKHARTRAPYVPHPRTPQEPIIKEVKEPLPCVDCGSLVIEESIRCRKCRGKLCTTQKIDWPEAPILLAMLSASSYSGVGRVLGVSDNAIRKHLKNSRVPEKEVKPS